MSSIPFWEFVSQNIILVSTCLVIVFVFAWFFKNLLKLPLGKKKISKCLDGENALETLEETKLDLLAKGYKKTIVIRTDNGDKTNVYASEFFSEANITKSLKINLRGLDSGSGVLVGLGLFGTFLGLTFGIIGFDSSNSQNIQSSIQSLLDGMGTAFITSLLGMGGSLLYTMIEKRWHNSFFKAIENLNQRLDEEYYIDDMSLMEMRQANMMQSLGETISKAIVKQSELVRSEIRSLLSYSNEDGANVLVANSIRDMLIENKEQTRALKSFSTDLALELNNGFDEVLSRQMQQRIVPLMENIDQTTRAVVEHIDRMAENVASPATEMIENMVTQLRGCMQSIIDEFRSSLSTSATNELEQLALTLGNAARAMGDFPRNMENITSTLQVTIEEVKNAITEMSNTSASTSSNAMQQMQEQISFATTSISNAITEVREVMSALTNSSQANVNEMISRMTGASDRMGEFMSQMMATVSDSVQDSMNSITRDIVERQNSLMETQREMIAEIRSNIQAMTSSSQESASGILATMNQAQTSMGAFMNQTMEEVADSVRDSLNSLADDITAKQRLLLDFQDAAQRETRRLVDSFNVGLDRLERMNTYISGTMSMFQQAQAEITGSTTNLRSISGDMKLATEIFQRKQDDYSRMIDELQLRSRSNIDSISALLRDSGQMSQDYVEKFNIIKGGLEDIFGKIQTGLQDYSATVQTSLQKFLDSYATSLTSATGALSNSVAEMSDSIEEFKEAIEQRR